MATIKQKSGVVEIEGEGGRRIVVHRMPWKAQREFLKKFAIAVQGILAARTAEAVDMMPAIMGRLPEIVSQSDELLNVLCLGSTGLTLDEFDGLDSLAATEVIRLSLEINFDDELKNSFAGIVGTLAALMPAQAKTTPLANSTAT